MQVVARETLGGVSAGARRGGRWVRALLQIVLLAAMLACASRGGPLADAERDDLAASAVEGPVATGQRKAAQSHDLHVSGAVSCGGFLEKEQLSFGRAWTTLRSTGELSNVLQLSVRFEYLSGLWRGRRQSRALEDASTVFVADRVSGFGKKRGCACIMVVAEARVPSVDRVRTRKLVCPEGLD